MHIATSFLYVYRFKRLPPLWSIVAGRWYVVVNLGRWVIEIGDEV